MIVEVCVNYCEMFELPCPSRHECARLPAAALVERFWWRLGAIDGGDSFIERNPRAIRGWAELYPCEDRQDCMAAICGTLEGRFPHQRLLAVQLLQIGAGVFSDYVRRWRAQSPEYRWMMAHLSGDLKHKAFRDLVLGHRYALRDQDGQG